MWVIGVFLRVGGVVVVVMFVVDLNLWVLSVDKIILVDLFVVCFLVYFNCDCVLVDC